MKRRVLFVDDEPQILENLKLRFYRLRNRWDMRFAPGGYEALALMSREPIDVIVTDMRMPKMDGATLLTRVQELHPGVIRIVLSGHAELETALRAVPVAHQFLTKPSEPGVIEDVIERACRLQELVNHELVKAAVGKTRQLPPRPAVYSRLMAALSNEQSTTADVAQILKQDVALSARILQVVNSAFFRLPRSVATLDEAVRYLGLRTVRDIALAAEVFQQAEARAHTPHGYSLRQLSRHSLLVAELASSLLVDKSLKEDAFVGGLLHDLGKLVLALELPEYSSRVLNEVHGSGRPILAAERELLGVTHAEVGGYLLGLWGLPYPLIETVAYHHVPSRVGSKAFGVLAATHIADCLLCEIEDPAGVGRGSELWDGEYIECLGVSGSLDGWRGLARTIVAQHDHAEA